jgi:hypothetical protein
VKKLLVKEKDTKKQALKEIQKSPIKEVKKT